MQGEAAGAQAFSNFDTFLAPYIRYDQLDYKQIKQCLQEFLFNLNVPTRVGFQTPFTNITMDLTVPDFLKNESDCSRRRNQGRSIRRLPSGGHFTE